MLKRYSRKELIEKVDGFLYEEFATSHNRWECETCVTDPDKSIPRQGMEQRLNNLKVFHERKRDYALKCEERNQTEDNINIFSRAQLLLEKLIFMEEDGTAANQEKYFKRDKNLFLSRSYIEFPLDKKINALYDDLSAVFLMYEDVATLGNNRAAVIEFYGNDMNSITSYATNHITDEEKREEFLSLGSVAARVKWAKEFWGENAVDQFEAFKTVEEKVEFCKKRVILTHRLLGGTRTPAIAIALSGEFAKAFTQFNAKQAILPEEFSEFGNISFSDTMKIQNNDIQQWIQTKIDLDKENFELVDVKEICGDEYRLVRSPQKVNEGGRNRENLMIRYVCPSTQRVYHNQINVSNLRTSKYFEENDQSTILEAWWHITHCGETPVLTGKYRDTKKYGELTGNIKRC